MLQGARPSHAKHTHSKKRQENKKINGAEALSLTSKSHNRIKGKTPQPFLLHRQPMIPLPLAPTTATSRKCTTGAHWPHSRLIDVRLCRCLPSRREERDREQTKDLQRGEEGEIEDALTEKQEESVSSTAHLKLMFSSCCSLKGLGHGSYGRRNLLRFRDSRSR